MNEMHGVIPPIITPFDAAGRIAEEPLGKLIDWYVEAGCHGLWVCGGTGEGVSLSREERRQMVELAMGCAAGRLPIAFHVGAPTTDDAVDAVRACQQAGVEAISSVPPFFFGKSDRETVEYFRRLADETDRPLFLYNLPDATGRPMTKSLVAEIVERVPGVVGIKHSATNLDFILEVLDLRDDLNVLIGRGELMLPALVLGARGAVCASLSMAPERFVHLYRAFREGDLEEAMSAQQHAASVKRLYQHFGVIAATKRVNTEQLGLDCGPPRGPTGALTAEEEPRLVDMARRLEMLPGKPATRPQVARS